MASLEHIGIAVNDVNETLRVFADLLGERPYGVESVNEDAVRTHFIWAGTAKLELLEKLDDASPVARFIEHRGEGIHHLAFEVDDIQAAFRRAEEAGYRPLDDAPRRGADGKLIFFLHPKQTSGVLFEFCQSAEPALRPLETSDQARIGHAGGSPRRVPCLYGHAASPAIDPASLARQLAPERAVLTFEAAAGKSAFEVLDTLEASAFHVVVDAGLRNHLSCIKKEQIRSLTLVDPDVRTIDEAGGAYENILVLLPADAAGLKRASSLRDRHPALSLVLASNSDDRLAVIASRLRQDPH